MEQKQANIGAVLGWALGLSVVLCWFPVVGPLAAGLVAGRKARCAGRAALVGIVTAAVWMFAFWFLSRGELHLRDRTYALTPLAALGITNAACALGGALIAVRGLAPRLCGAVAIVAGLGWLTAKVNDVRTTVNTFVSAPARTQAVDTGAATCPEHLKQLYSALSLYAGQWDDTLPPADRWMTAIKDNTDDKALRCPAVGGGSAYGYAMNAALGGKKLAIVKDRSKTPLLYDSTDLAANAHDAMSSLPAPGRHGGRNYVLFADGTVGQK